ncbi:MAG: hypothetical protein MR270_07430 [Erysipelotrichaceae bacterium]|nr:hypothetical protein [Erysipelotrichaceae bacterium]
MGTNFKNYEKRSQSFRFIDTLDNCVSYLGVKLLLIGFLEYDLLVEDFSKAVSPNTSHL